MRCVQCGIDNPENSRYCSGCAAPLNAVGAQIQPHALLAGELIGGRYRIGKVLGQGGFGITYKGADTKLNRLVAIKEYFQDGSTRRGKTVIPPNTLTSSDHQKALERFKEEAKTLAKLTQNHIVRVYDFVEENGTGYIVMEYLEGKSLEGEIVERGKMGEKETKEIIVEVLEGLEEVHRNGILHRDIKPGNILMTTRGAVLVDFGTSREFAMGQSKQMSQIVTPGYAPLEQYSAKGKFGPPLDIYAIGATLYRMLTGDIPPASTDIAGGSMEIELNGKVSVQMEGIIEKCMRTKVQDRYWEVKELLWALEGQETGDPINKPYGGSYRLLRGGSWSNYAATCRSAYRNNYYPSITYNLLGFRLARTVY